MTDKSPQEICDSLTKEPEIRFAAILDMMGNAVASSFRSDVKPLKNETERKKMFIEAVLRIRTRQDFDENLGPVEFAAAKRKNVVTLTFLKDDNVIFVSAEPDVSVDATASKIISMCQLN